MHQREKVARGWGPGLWKALEGEVKKQHPQKKFASEKERGLRFLSTERMEKGWETVFGSRKLSTTCRGELNSSEKKRSEQSQARTENVKS